MDNEKAIIRWEQKKKLKEEKKKKVLDFIDFLMEEYDISENDLF